MSRPQFSLKTLLERDFDRVCWHDCHIWGLSFHTGEPQNDDWTSELVFDIDFICEWCCNNDSGRFSVAPAFLVFHGVEAAEISIHWGAGQIYPLSIAEISRDQTGQYSLPSGKTNYRWEIKLNWPQGGRIAFHSFGFTQTLRTEPALIDEQCFSLKARTVLLEGVSRPPSTP
ncbi:MAG TPA: hypothetical protein PK867_06075 [Pirellulales bacterium]|nr:hypothetical protein [Pirellulales bacterium]